MSKNQMIISITCGIIKNFFVSLHTSKTKRPNMNDNRTKIIELLRSTSRGGIENVITWLDTEPSFFTASAARIHHDNVEGGLANHSLNVFRHAKEDWDTRDDAFKKKYPFESVIISALLHLTSRLGTRPTIWSIVLTMVALLRKENRSCSTRSGPSTALPCSMVTTLLSLVHSVVACSNSNLNSSQNISSRCLTKKSFVASSTRLSLRCSRVRPHLVRRLRKRATLLPSTRYLEDLNN